MKKLINLLTLVLFALLALESNAQANDRTQEDAFKIVAEMFKGRDVDYYSATLKEITPTGNVTDYIDLAMYDVQTAGYVITVTSLTEGTEVYRTELPSGQKSHRIDMTPYKNGMYVLNCILGDTVLNSHKFVKR